MRSRTAAVPGWKRHTLAFTAESAETVLEFLSLDAVGSTCGPMLDGISVVSLQRSSSKAP